jgi:hypothetical protein
MQQSTTLNPRQTDRLADCRFRLADHRVVWPRVLPGLETLHAMHDEQEWTVASVRKMLDNDLAMLLTDDDDPAAFAVVILQPYPYAEKASELFVYLLWHQGGDVIMRYQPHLEAFAAKIGAKYIRFYSRRAAFLRVASRVGYKMRGIEYAKELHHGRR